MHFECILYFEILKSDLWRPRNACSMLCWCAASNFGGRCLTFCVGLFRSRFCMIAHLKFWSKQPIRITFEMVGNCRQSIRQFTRRIWPFISPLTFSTVILVFLIFGFGMCQHLIVALDDKASSVGDWWHGFIGNEKPLACFTSVREWHLFQDLGLTCHALISMSARSAIGNVFCMRAFNGVYSS